MYAASTIATRYVTTPNAAKRKNVVLSVSFSARVSCLALYCATNLTTAPEYPRSRTEKYIVIDVVSAQRPYAALPRWERLYGSTRRPTAISTAIARYRVVRFLPTTADSDGAVELTARPLRKGSP